MFVCLCKGITDTQIQESVNNGATSLAEVRSELGVATQCCKCLPLARSIIDETLAEQDTTFDQSALPLFYSA